MKSLQLYFPFQLTNYFKMADLSVYTKPQNNLQCKLTTHTLSYLDGREKTSWKRENNSTSQEIQPDTASRHIPLCSNWKQKQCAQKYYNGFNVNFYSGRVEHMWLHSVIKTFSITNLYVAKQKISFVKQVKVWSTI